MFGGMRDFVLCFCCYCSFVFGNADSFLKTHFLALLVVSLLVPGDPSSLYLQLVAANMRIARGGCRDRLFVVVRFVILWGRRGRELWECGLGIAKCYIHRRLFLIVLVFCCRCTFIHPSVFAFDPVSCHSLSSSDFASLYPPILLENLWRGLKLTSSLLQMDLNR